MTKRPVKRKTNNPAPRDREECRLPRRAGINTKIAWKRNERKAHQTLGKYRTGYRKAWSVPNARRYMKSIGLLKPGDYNPNNQQGGVMFSLPSECKITDKQAQTIMTHCIECKKLTECNLKDIKKMLSYAYQITQREKGNYPGVTWAWSTMDPDKTKPPTKSLVPKVILSPSGLKTAFTTEYGPDTGMDFMLWNTRCLLTHDLNVFGCRQVEDINRIRDSESHLIVPSQGWMCTDFVGGRAKLEAEKGVRPWKLYRRCLCPGGEHKHLPNNWDTYLNRKGNPKRFPLPWCTTCPLNVFGAIREWNKDNRTYPHWTGKQFAPEQNLGEDSRQKHMQAWLDAQGANPDGVKFDSNSGRKALGKWCDEFNVPYEESMEIHGDHWDTWKKNYQPRLRREPEINRREQSTDPETCLRALNRFARGIGRGSQQREDPEQLTNAQRDRLTMALMRRMGMGAEVNAIIDGHRT